MASERVTASSPPLVSDTRAAGGGASGGLVLHGDGKRPQALGREIPGFVVNRLQAVLFREAVYLVSQGIVSEQALDDVVTASIGMRWAVAGPFRTFHLGGGPAGLPAFRVHLGPASPCSSSLAE